MSTPPLHDETQRCVQTKTVVMETGRSWVVCGALSSMYLLALGYQQVFGIFFVAFQSEFESSASATASIMAVYAANYSLMSLVSCNVLVKRLQARTITLIGGFIVSVGVSLGTFAESIAFLMVTNGVILGIGCGFIFGPAVVTVGKYFDKRKTIATTIVTAGASVGGIVLPPLARVLLDEYDVRGAMLIFGAFLLHVIPAALLLTPRMSRHFEINMITESKGLLKSDGNLKQIDDINTYEREIKLNHLSLSVTSLPLTSKELKSDLNPCSNISLEYKNYTSLPENINESKPVVLAQSSETDSDQLKGTVGSSSTNFKEKLKKKLRHAVDPSLFKTPVFYVFIGFHAFASTGIVVFSSFIPPIGKDNGLTDGQCAMLVSLYSVLDLFCRFYVAYISDRNWIKRYRLLAGCFVILGTVYHFVRFYTSFSLMIFFVVIFGLFGGAFNSLHPIIAVDFLGKEKFHTVFGYVQFTHGMVRIVAFPVVGALRDFTGNYVASCHYLGTSFYISAFLLMLKPLVTKEKNSSVTF